MEQRGGRIIPENKEGVVRSTGARDANGKGNVRAGILHQEQEWNGKTVLRPIAYGSKVLSDTEMKYGAPKAEMFAVVTSVEKYRAYLGSGPFKLRVDNRGTQLVENVHNGSKLHREMDSSPGWIQHDN